MKTLLGLFLILVCSNFQGCADKKQVTPAKFTTDTVFDSLKRSFSGSSPKTEVDANQAIAKIGDTVSIGVFGYSVESILFRKEIRSDAIRETADGVFLLLTLTFMNRDRRSHALDSTLVRLFDGKKILYRYSGSAADVLVMGGKKTILSKECKPAGAISGVMIFDVPSKQGEYFLRVSNGAWKEETREIRLAGVEDR